MPLAVLAERITRKLSTQNSVVILCSEGYTKEYSPGFQGAIDTIDVYKRQLIAPVNRNADGIDILTVNFQRANTFGHHRLGFDIAAVGGNFHGIRCV